MFVEFPLADPLALSYLPLNDFIAFGPGECLDFAFKSGASDYIKEPWDLKELVVRVSHAFSAGALSLFGTSISLTGQILNSDSGHKILTKRETAVIRLLHRRSPNPVFRFEIALVAGFEKQHGRGLDMMLSRLRKILREISNETVFSVLVSKRNTGVYLLPLFSRC